MPDCCRSRGLFVPAVIESCLDDELAVLCTQTPHRARGRAARPGTRVSTCWRRWTLVRRAPSSVGLHRRFTRPERWKGSRFCAYALVKETPVQKSDLTR